jgi:hypothetical protein
MKTRNNRLIGLTIGDLSIARFLPLGRSERVEKFSLALSALVLVFTASAPAQESLSIQAPILEGSAPAIEQIIHQYILQHPEVVRESDRTLHAVITGFPSLNTVSMSPSYWRTTRETAPDNQPGLQSSPAVALGGPRR